ncbi:hypothetical protein [Herbaspirillum sp. alder98]|uniref:hypothetical protein n=1 Tax=Herbaspirillum sp. alder98 TaxID=2913096 RepID=UPI001CD8D6EA|nr:hypothetical protein [Herbaspirillum sp. alder98]MCA1324875.1 hypothetical protein [Herbaspirillum sp. alder98]
MNYTKHVVAALMGAYCMASHAGLVNDIPSCYTASKIGVPIPAPQTELFVAIDQTTPLDATLQQSVRENVGRLITPGAAYVMASFSSFGQGHYLQVLSAGTLEAPVPDKMRDDISVKALTNFDACMKGQLDYGRKAAAGSLGQAMTGASPDFAKSDILAAMKELSSRVRQSTATNKIVFLVSDTLENSSISSFYANRNVRNIDPVVELKKAEAAQQIGDFGGARVFILGAGLIQDGSAGKSKDSGVYRDPKTMQNLRQFWSKYFEKSNATLVDFGAPALLSPVR